MKKLIAGFVMAVVASPAVQAWTGGIEDMRTMEANERGPVIRVKSHHVQAACRLCATPHRRTQQRMHHTYHPQRSAQQIVRRSAQRAASSRPAYNQTQRVVSEKIYVQKVHRYPAAFCPLK